MFAGHTDPYPYIAAAYMVAAVGIFGITAWIYKERSMLRKKLYAVDQDRGAQK